LTFNHERCGWHIDHPRFDEKRGRRQQPNLSFRASIGRVLIDLRQLGLASSLDVAHGGDPIWKSE
jgi:hypothetical protein